MKLFDVIPERFFSLLASPSRAVYAEAVLLLYEHYQANQFGIPYEIIRDAFQELIETIKETGTTFDQPDEEETLTEFTSDTDLFRSKANLLLRQLRNYGWIDVEDRANYQRFIVLPHYSSRLLEVLKDLCNHRAVEYQRFAFVTFTLLASRSDRPAYAILEAEDTTRKFIGALRELTNNMRNHMDEVVKKTSIQEVLDYHFDEYKTKIVDRSYHRLKTSDHVSRYRLRILEIVQNYLTDPEHFQELVLSGLQEDISLEKAEELLRSALLYIEEAYRNLDDTLYQIDLRHHQYVRASFDRARYLGQYSQGLDKRLGQVLEWAAQNESAALDDAFSLIRISHVNEGSLLPPRKKRQPLEPEAPAVVVIPEELRQRQRDLNLTRMKQAITREKVTRYVLERMGDRQNIFMEELAPESAEDFIYLAFAYLYGSDGKSGYQIKRHPDHPIAISSRYSFSNHQIVKTSPKGAGTYVRRP